MFVRDDLRLGFAKSKGDILNDFQKLCDLEPEMMVDDTSFWTVREGCPVPKPLYLYRILRTGQMLSERFHWNHRVRTRTINNVSAEDRMKQIRDDPPLWARNAFQRTRKHSPSMRVNDIWMHVIQTNSALYSLTHFRATVSKHLCDVTHARRVLDFSAGWGDRLTGFLASESVQEITLIDPRPGSIRACKAQHAYINSKKKLKTLQRGAEDALPTLRSNSVDLIITSPPYFNLEHYGETEAEAVGQIRLKVDSNEAYLKYFLQPVLGHCARVLAPGGLLALNVDDNPRLDVRICKPALQELRKLSSLTFVGTAGLRKGQGMGHHVEGTPNAVRAEPIYIFRKHV